MRARKRESGALPAGPGARSVLSAAETLWPAPGSSWLGRRVPGSVTNARYRAYTVVPTVQRPRFLVPRAPEAAAALRPTQQGVKGLRMVVLGHLQRWSVLGRVPGTRLHVLPDAAGAGIEDLLSAVVGDVAQVVVRLGRPRPNRTLVLWAFGSDWTPVGIAKLSRGDAAKESMEAEYAALARSPAAGIRDLVAPRVLGYLRWNDNDVLVISALVSADARPWHAPPVPQMKALAGSTGVAERPLRDTAFVARLGEQIGALTSVTDQVWLRSGLERLVGDHGDTVVRTGAWHGDWVSWNQSVDKDTVLLWDWEHYHDSALAGFDHVHFLAQEQRARGTDVRAEDAWLAAADAALAAAWGLEADQRLVVLRAYLLEVNLRFVRDRQAEDETIARAGWARSLVERLADAPARS